MSTPDQVVRLLRLAPFLQAHPDVPVREVATMLGVTPRQVVKDLHVLMMCGTGPYGGQLIDVDLDMLEAEGRIRITNADVLRHPMRLTPGEVVPLVLGLRVLADAALPAQRRAIDSALRRLAEAGADLDAADRVELRSATGSDDVRATITAALESGRRLRLRYAGRVTTDRVVDPDRIVLQQGVVYLQAWSEVPDVGEGGSGWRTFRVDRILEARVCSEPAHEHPEPDARDAWAAALAGAEAVVLDVEPHGVWVAELYPIEQDEPRPDGHPGRRLTLRVVDRAWFIELALRLGPAARIVTPDAAREAVRREAERALAGHAATSRDGPEIDA